MTIIFCKGVPSLRWLESPKANRFRVKGVRDHGVHKRSHVCVCVCVCVCVLDYLINDLLKQKEGD